jgi:hypothetical protein
MYRMLLYYKKTDLLVISELAPIQSHITSCCTLRTSGFIRLSTSGFFVTHAMHNLNENTNCLIRLSFVGLPLVVLLDCKCLQQKLSSRYSQELQRQALAKSLSAVTSKHRDIPKQEWPISVATEQLQPNTTQYKVCVAI